MRFLCLTSRITTPSRVGTSTGIVEEEDPDREIYRNLWQQRRLMPPKGSPYSKRHHWRNFLLVLVAYEQMYIPLQLAFHLPRPDPGDEFQLPLIQLLLQYCIDLCFMVDIALVFRTTLLGKAEEGSQIITDLSVSARAHTRLARLCVCMCVRRVLGARMHGAARHGRRARTQGSARPQPPSAAAAAAAAPTPLASYHLLLL